MVQRRNFGVLALVVLVAGCTFLLQPFGFNQAAHYSLTKALATGTPRLDDFQAFAGDESFFKGHYYSNKAPGVAFLCLPFYLVLRALHLPSGVHVLALLASALPALILFLLVRRVGDDWAAGFGVAAAMTLAAATLFLPFTSLLFAHVLSSLLGFSAFVVLWTERRGRSRLWLVAAAGLLAGLGVVVEYPVALVAIVLGLYALSRAPLVRRGLSYAGGVAGGVVPLLLYNRWAFGSFTHLSYSNLVLVRGKSGHDVVEGFGGHAGPGFFHAGPPRLRQGLELLFLSRGLLRLTPVLALGIVGLVMLWRRGLRAEAVAIAGITAVVLGYVSGFADPFGGWGPGPRYLMPMIPFLAATLAVVYARAPLTTAALATVSAASMVVATATDPLLPNNALTFSRLGDIADTGRWFHRFASGDFTRTVATSAGLGHGWVGIAPFLVAVGVAYALAVAATRWPRFERRDAATAVVALAGWLLLAVAAPVLLHHDRAAGGTLGAATTVTLAASVALTGARVWRSGLGAALPALPLLAFGAHALPRHTTWSVTIASVVLVVSLSLELLVPRRVVEYAPPRRL